jgi:DNA-binding transcriptional MerR regulator
MSTNVAPRTTRATTTDATVGEPERLIRIHEVAELVAMTPRTIRYYEEVGLLEPAARSEGAYRLYDEDDVERLRYIKAMRDAAGFSLAEIGTLLEDERARSRSRERYLATTDPMERQSILEASAARLNRQIATLRAKRDRLEGMIGDAQERLVRVQRRLAELEPTLAAGPDGRVQVDRPARPRSKRKASS